MDKNNNNEIIVKFDEVTKKYGDLVVLDKLNLEIKKNHHVVITGPNGSGKSTLLGLSTGIFYPDSGKVKTFSNKIGYVSANPMILNSTLRENLIYGNNENTKPDELMIKYLKEFKVFEDNEKIDLTKKINNK